MGIYDHTIPFRESSIFLSKILLYHQLSEIEIRDFLTEFDSGAKPFHNRYCLTTPWGLASSPLKIAAD